MQAEINTDEDLEKFIARPGLLSMHTYICIYTYISLIMIYIDLQFWKFTPSGVGHAWECLAHCVKSSWKWVARP